MNRTLSLALLLLPGLALAGPKVSDQKKDNKLGDGYWGGSATIDGKMETAWQLPGTSENSGEWISFDLPASTIDGIEIFAGFGATEETYTDYARIKTLQVDVMCCTGDSSMKPVHSTTLQLEDKPEVQVLPLGGIAIGSDLGFGGSIRLTVKEVYPGVDFSNLAVSELAILLKEQDVMFMIQEISGAADGHPQDHMTDGNAMTYWAGPSDSSMTIFSEGQGISSLMITPGPKSHARPKRVKVSANDRSVETELEDSGQVQAARTPNITGYTGSIWGGEVTLEILEVYPGSSSEEVAIKELKVNSTNYDPL